LDSEEAIPAADTADTAAARQAKVLWTLKGGGRWGLELKEIAWSVRLDERGRSLFAAGQARALVREACAALEAAGEIESRGQFYRLLQWRNEPW
jgi:hypothetical protein